MKNVADGIYKRSNGLNSVFKESHDTASCAIHEFPVLFA
jgi:hypothetical protein